MHQVISYCHQYTGITFNLIFSLFLGLVVIPNTFGHYYVPKDAIWPLCEQEKKGKLVPGNSNYYILIKTIQQDENDMYPTSTQDNNNDTLSTAISMYSDINGKNTCVCSPTQILKKQRWVTLDSQYHWGTKKNNLDISIPIPHNISDLMESCCQSNRRY